MRAALLVLIGLWLPAGAWSAQDAGTAYRQQARESYREFLRLAPVEDPRRANALRRLGDLEQQRAERLLLESDRPADAQDVYASAIALYRELLGFYPDYPGNDAVRYQLARALEAHHDPDGALDTLAVLIQAQPDSGYVDEAHFRRGEALFSRGDYGRAADAYAAVIALGEDPSRAAPFREQAWYKHGWALFRLADYDLAQGSFLSLLRHRLAPGGKYRAEAHQELAPGTREMLDDSLRAMSLSFAYLDGVASLDSLLDSDTAPGFEHLLYQDLGDLYLDQERFSDAALTYRAYSDRYPNAPDAPLLMLAVIDTYREAGFAAEELNARESFAARYVLRDPDGVASPYWTGRTPDQAPAVIAALKQHVSELAAHYHALTQAGDDPGEFARAVYWYRTWLASFPDHPETPATHFLLAELLFERGEFEPATQAYEQVAYDYGDHEMAAEAGYAALLSYQRHAPSLAAATLAAWQRRGIDSALRFSATFARHPQATSVLVKASQQLFDVGELAAASAAARKLLSWDPAPPERQRRTAWLVVGHASFDQGEYSVAEQAFTQVLALPGDDATEIGEKLAAAVYKQGEARRAEGDLTGAVEDFLRVGQVAPGTSVRVTAEYDAAAALVQIQDWSRAATVLNDLRRRYPDHELAADVPRRLAAVYVESGRPADAADELAGMARDTGGPISARRDAAWQAASLYREAGDRDGEIAACAYLIETLDAPLDDSIDARERIASIHAARGDEAARLRWLETIVAADRDAGTGRTDRSRSAAASASLVLAEIRLPAFMGVRLVRPLKASLQKKQAGMKSLLDAYGAAAEYGVATVTTAATHRIADLYAEMARALLASEPPLGMTAEELEQYQFLLEEQAFPFEEQAIETYMLNTDRSASGVYDEWVRKSFAALATLVPARYNKIERGESYVDVLD